MKFCCPYCKHVFGEEPLAKCPACGKTASIPGPFRKNDKAARAARRNRFRREMKREGVPPVVELARKPSTLFAMLAVMTVVGGLLISRTGSTTAARQRQTPAGKAAKELTVLRTAMEYFRIHCGDYPEEQYGLMALINNPGAPAWCGPYVRLIRPDPWKNPYVYSRQGGEIRLYSCGPDKKAGTADDIFPDAIDFEKLPAWLPREKPDSAQEGIPVSLVPVPGGHSGK